jgi:hypothetical protein
MPDKTPTYRINEESLRHKLLDYRVEVNPARCEAIEKEVANIRFKKTISIPKVNLRVVIPAVLIVGVTTLIIFNLDSIKDLFAPAPEIKKIEYKAPAQVTKPEEKPSAMPSTLPGTVSVPAVETPSTVATPPHVHNNVVATPSVTNTDANKKNDSSAESNKKPNPVLAQPPSDSSVKKEDTTKAIKEDTSSIQKAEAPVKKKKKRRRRNANMEELKESTLQQGGSDDDVVVPQ